MATHIKASVGVTARSTYILELVEFVRNAGAGALEKKCERTVFSV